jgi:hypothetical protein
LEQLLPEGEEIINNVANYQMSIGREQWFYERITWSLDALEENRLTTTNQHPERSVKDLIANTDLGNGSWCLDSG